MTRQALAALLCASSMLLPTSPAGAQGVNTSLIKLTYRCGNWFRVRSANSVDAALQYSVYRTSEHGVITLPAAPTSIGYSDTWLQTQNRGALLLTFGGARVAEKPNGNAACAPVAAAGQWSDTLSWPTVAIATALLPNGKVVTYGREYAAENPPHFVIPPGKFDGVPFLWDPKTGLFTNVDAHADFFCSGLTFLADGRLIVMGGNAVNDGTGQRFNYTFDGSTWTHNAPMADGRWYPTLTTLPTGDVFVMSGTDTNNVIDSIPELYHVTAGNYAELTGLTAKIDFWAWVFVAPNGQLFYAGDQTDFTYYIDPSGTGSQGAGFRSINSITRDYGSAVMYDTGKILIVGGGNTSATAEVIDLNQATPAWRSTSSMHFARRQMNAVLLANGQIMASGGSAGPDFNPATNIVYTPEIWDPVTEVWTEVANYKLPRLYHSETLLLPDARILSVGGGHPAATGLPDNFNAEIYSPPYLFNPDGTPTTASRPIIVAAPTVVSYGSNMQLTVQNVAAGTAKVLWIRLGAVTHAIDMNQRLNHLVSSQSGTTLTVTAPANANLAPPGHYQLFVLNANGVPSMGTIIQIH